MINRIRQKYADYIGITGSTICLIHCIGTSGLMLFSSLVPGMHEHHQGVHEHHLDFWGMVDVFMLALTALAVVWASKSTHHGGVKLLLWVFLFLFMVATLIKYTAFTMQWIEVTAWMASFGLIATHLYNLYLCRRGVCRVA
ncbi:MerC domain-containing protein [Algivirga pacifica]|uniref:MerC mercury resistance protein n=1 Tax=Algivirga pacifica TaxID=1162670 RepID=A0ABP9DHQ2_9BACT